MEQSAEWRWDDHRHANESQDYWSQDYCQKIVAWLKSSGKGSGDTMPAGSSAILPVNPNLIKSWLVSFHLIHGLIVSVIIVDYYLVSEDSLLLFLRYRWPLFIVSNFRWSTFFFFIKDEFFFDLPRYCSYDLRFRMIFTCAREIEGWSLYTYLPTK